MNHSSKQCTELPVEKRWITNDLQDVAHCNKCNVRPFYYSIFIHFHLLIELSLSYNSSWKCPCTKQQICTHKHKLTFTVCYLAVFSHILTIAQCISLYSLSFCLSFFRSFFLSFFLTSWLSRAVASFWTSGVSSWVPLMTLLSAARDWWILCDNTYSLVYILCQSFRALLPGVSSDTLPFDCCKLVHYGRPCDWLTGLTGVLNTIHTHLMHLY